MPFRARHLDHSTPFAALVASSFVAVLSLSLAPRLGAQAAPAPQGPAGWSWSLDRPARFQNGSFGFRIGPGVNLHITNLDINRRLAPARRR